MIIVTTSAVAERFNLPSARLQNAEGNFVRSDATAMALAREQMTVRADGVLVPNAAAVRGGGYPLTANAYALVDVAKTTQAQNDAFATILEYAAGDGQRNGTAVGQLPPGYAPLSAGLADKTRAAARLLRNPSSLLPEPSLAPVATSVTAPAPAALSAQPPASRAPGVVATVAPSASVVTPSSAPPASGPSPAAARPSPGTAALPAPVVREGESAQAPLVRQPRNDQPRSIQRRGNQPRGDQQRGDQPQGDESATVEPAPAPPAAPALAKPPAVLTQVGAVATTSSPTTPLRWTIPVLLLISVLAAYAGRVLPALGRTSS